MCKFVDGKVYVYKVLVEKGIVIKGDLVELEVDYVCCMVICVNYLVIYLLYEVLWNVFGEYVVQCGFLNVEDCLWFDFSYIKVLLVVELIQVVDEVNVYIC